MAAGARAAAPAPDPGPGRRRGAPGEGYPYPWSVYRWLDGETASEQAIGDLTEFATTLAGFLVALRGSRRHRRPGARARTTSSAAVRSRRTRTRPSRRSRRSATRSPARRRSGCGTTRWRPPGTASPSGSTATSPTGNLLLRDGRLAAVIDFGTSGVGDPACDVVIAWTLLFGAEPRRVPRRARRRSGHLGARPRLGAVEGADHARRGTRS